MANAKALTPGIHMMSQTMVWEGKTVRPLSVDEARGIAEVVCKIPDILDRLDVIRTELERAVSIPARLLSA